MQIDQPWRWSEWDNFFCADNFQVLPTGEMAEYVNQLETELAALRSEVQRYRDAPTAIRDAAPTHDGSTLKIASDALSDTAPGA